MTYPINQISVLYHPIEDRMLLTIEMEGQQVYTGWITRRFLKLLIPALHGVHPLTGKTLFDNKTSKAPTIKQSKPILKKTIESPNDPMPASYPLGETPILLSKISFKGIQKDYTVFILSPESGHGIELPFNPSVLNTLLSQFTAPLQESGWSLEVNTIYGMPLESGLQ